MPEPQQQDYANHGRTDPLFHRFLVPVSALTIIVAPVNAFRHPGFNSAWLILVSIAAGVALFKMRLYSLKVQDRVIRLEERLLTAIALGTVTHAARPANGGTTDRASFCLRRGAAGIDRSCPERKAFQGRAEESSNILAS